MIEISNIASALVEPRKAPEPAPVKDVPKTVESQKSSRIEYKSASAESASKSVSIEAREVDTRFKAPPGAHQSIDKVIGEANDNLKRINADLAIEVDRDLKQVIFKVIDLETGETIKQIPSEEMIRVAKKLKAIIESYAESKADSQPLFMDSGSFA